MFLSKNYAKLIAKLNHAVKQLLIRKYQTYKINVKSIIVEFTSQSNYFYILLEEYNGIINLGASKNGIDSLIVFRRLLVYYSKAQYFKNE